MKDQSSLTPSHVLHQPVLVQEVLHAFSRLPSDLLKGGLMVDATLGYGGHATHLLKAYPDLRLIGLDQDPNSRLIAAQYLSSFGSRVKIVGINFSEYIPSEKVVAVFADLGVSSPQLDVPERGFSFRLDGPLDMRMNPDMPMSAADLIEKLDERQLAEIIYNYGEEKFSRRIAKRIKKDLREEGQYSGTKALAYAVAGCYPPQKRYGRIHPATRTFQALRIAVNNELDALQRFLQVAPDWLLPKGIFGIISFHSLEDRQVKKAFLGDSRLERITRKPLTASPEEVSMNGRSRSAKCRFACKLID